MTTRRMTIAMLAALFCAGPTAAQDKQPEKLKVMATFSIIADLVQNVGGERVEVSMLVGPASDAHVYSPSPADAKRLADAKVVVMNGLGFEGWIDRLVKASGSKAPVVVAANGVKPRRMADSHGHSHGSDPHAWQSVANVKIYTTNIRNGLIAVDPAGKPAYEAHAAAYLAKLDALEREVREAVGKIPADRRRIITTHDAFGYFKDAYGLDFIAPQGVSTESQPSAKDVARIITQIRRQKIPAVFLENISDARLLTQIANETGAKIGGTLYSDALTDANGPAPTYIDLIRHNLKQFATALTTS